MEKLKNISIVALYVLLMTVFFAGGYAFGSYRSDYMSAVRATPEAVRAVSAPSVEESGGEKITVYTVILENSDLYLYSVTDGVNTEIARHKISEGIFPSEDMEMLRNGVTLDNLGDAQAVFENFVS